MSQFSHSCLVCYDRSSFPARYFTVHRAIRPENWLIAKSKSDNYMSRRSYVITLHHNWSQRLRLSSLSSLFTHQSLTAWDFTRQCRSPCHTPWIDWLPTQRLVIISLSNKPKFYVITRHARLRLSFISHVPSCTAWYRDISHGSAVHPSNALNSRHHLSSFTCHIDNTQKPMTKKTASWSEPR